MVVSGKFVMKIRKDGDGTAGTLELPSFPIHVFPILNYCRALRKNISLTFYSNHNVGQLGKPLPRANVLRRCV